MVANKADSEYSELLDFVLAAEVTEVGKGCTRIMIMTVGLKSCNVGGADVCGPQQRLEDPHACSRMMLPIENPRGMAGLAKQKFADSYREFDTDPTDPECP